MIKRLLKFFCWLNRENSSIDGIANVITEKNCQLQIKRILSEESCERQWSEGVGRNISVGKRNSDNQ